MVQLCKDKLLLQYEGQQPHQILASKAGRVGRAIYKSEGKSSHVSYNM